MTRHTIPPSRGLVAVRAEMSGSMETKAALEDLHRAFASFKDEHKQQLAEVKSGFADVVRAEKLDRINSSIGELQAALDEVNARVAAMTLGGVGDNVKDREYTEAFQAHMKKGDIRAALNKGADAEGGYLAPIEWDRTITDKLVQVSPMRQIAQVQQIGGAGYKKLFNAGGTGSGWVGETAARPETTTPTLAELTFTTGELYANPAATQQILDDAVINLEQWLAGEVETEFAYQEGLAFVSGNGTNKPRGFLTYVTGGVSAAVHPWGVIPEMVAASATAITADELIALAYSLPAELSGNARFVMNRNTIAAIRQLKDTTGQYLWQPSLTAGEPQTIAGFPVTEMPAMPNPVANAYPVAFGDFRRGYLIIDRMGVRVLRDPYSNKPYVMFYTTKRVGGALQNPEVLRVLKMAAA